MGSWVSVGKTNKSMLQGFLRKYTSWNLHVFHLYQYLLFDLFSWGTGLVKRSLKLTYSVGTVCKTEEGYLVSVFDLISNIPQLGVN